MLKMTCDLLVEIKRVLRPGGAFVISTQDPEQHLHGFWWGEIIPDAVKTLAGRFPKVSWLQETFKQLGFESVESTIPPQTLMNPTKYLNANGPFEKEFRNGDSTWSLATPEQLEKGLEWYKSTIIDTNKAEEYLNKREKIRNEVGQTTSICGFVPME